MLENRTARNQQREGAADMIDAAGAERGRAVRADRVAPLVGDFGAERQARRDRAGEREPALPEVAIARARIDRVAAAAEQRPSAEILLSPDRQEQPDPASAEAAACGRQDRAW